MCQRKRRSCRRVSVSYIASDPPLAMAAEVSGQNVDPIEMEEQNENAESTSDCGTTEDQLSQNIDAAIPDVEERHVIFRALDSFR